MNEQQPKFHRYFHNFLIYFALFAYALFAVLYGGKYILHAVENDPEYKILIMILGILLISLGVFLIKVRFDLAAFRPQAPQELFIACIAGAVIALCRQLIEYVTAGETPTSRIITVITLVCFGIALRRYYLERPYLFSDKK